MYPTAAGVLHRKHHKELCQTLDLLSNQAKECYNSILFVCRQSFFLKGKSQAELSDNEKQVLDRWKQLDTLRPLKNKDGTKRERARSYFSYASLEAYAKEFLPYQTKASPLPSACVQQICKMAAADMHSYFQSVKAFKAEPQKFTSRSELPRYKKKDRFLIPFTNQQCFIVWKGEEAWIQICRFGRVKIALPKRFVRLKSVQIVPWHDSYKLLAVCETEDSPRYQERFNPGEQMVLDPKGIAGMDIGVDVLAAVVTGQDCLLVNGKELKSVNQFFNKRMARLSSRMDREYKDKKHPLSRKQKKRMEQRENQMTSRLHLASCQIVDWLEKRNIHTLVVGKTTGWKQEVTMNGAAKQNFIQIPFNRFLKRLEYKALQAGMEVIFQEESYTSKASFLDRDPIPVYGEEKEEVLFSGQRLKRPLYQSGDGTMIHADLNGAANIARKHFPDFQVDPDVFSRIETIRL